ncbi:hypothetical protein HPB47_013222 [Ixodes persulcatus]|uniref:Uncharacterized protein n=1 Tax=Ixodes persulcatus TaxID=34615 RepID=A0AC60R0Q5_IXOPE|nr:hypothetical protein HPB47_013222 [Ixodes persulcatus]
MAAPPGWLVVLLLCLVTSKVEGWKWYYFASKHRVSREDRRCRPEPNGIEVGDRATCPFDVFMNVDPKRVPVKIPIASCRCPKFRCAPNRRCVSLSYALEVLYNRVHQQETEQRASQVEIFETSIIKMTIKVAVVGAGIIGMTTAVRTLETVAHVSVTVIAEHFTPHTTGDVAAGFFKPYSVSGVSDEKLRDWCIESYNFYNELLHSEDAPRLGLAEMPAYHLEESWNHANIIGDFVGLRPGRDPLRIERENRIVQDGTKTFPIIHNYGHGGSGVTLAWGCAGEAVRLLEDVIRDNISVKKTLARL